MKSHLSLSVVRHSPFTQNGQFYCNITKKKCTVAMELNAMMTLGKIGEHVIAFAGMPTPLSRILRSGIRSECHRRASEGTDGGG